VGPGLQRDHPGRHQHQAEQLHARHRLGQPILIATAAVALSVQEFLRISHGARERWTPPVFNQPIALAAPPSALDLTR